MDETLWLCLLFKASINISYIAVGVRGLLKQSSVQKIYNGLQGYWQRGRTQWHSATGCIYNFLIILRMAWIQFVFNLFDGSFYFYLI